MQEAELIDDGNKFPQSNNIAQQQQQQQDSSVVTSSAQVRPVHSVSVAGNCGLFYPTSFR